MTVAVNCDALRPCKISGAIACFAERPNEFPFRIENLDAVIERIGDVKISVFIDGYICRI
jgi:hypothetical protein